jgi:hypothetical protein
MRSILVLSFALMAFGSFVDSAGAGGRGWGVAVSCVDPDEYGYDGYKPPLMYYRAYYGDTPICRHRWHRIHARSQG